MMKKTSKKMHASDIEFIFNMTIIAICVIGMLVMVNVVMHNDEVANNAAETHTCNVCGGNLVYVGQVVKGYRSRTYTEYRYQCLENARHHVDPDAYYGE